jgi:hypothetical protein
MNTPVVFFIFNRPDLTRQVFAAIAKARPPKLFIVADGPRPDRPGEALRCAEAREAAAAVDWECEVSTRFSDRNLGCRDAVAGGLDWVFSLVDAAIILEDDCLPHPDFFPYCEDLLERYRTVDRVMMISGTSSQKGNARGDASYFFARYCHCWGWATWRRAWQHYDVSMEDYPRFLAEGEIRRILRSEAIQRRWLQIFDLMRAKAIDTWDYQWVFAIWRRDGVSATPNVNLVSNIGFGPEATHTFDRTSPFARMPVASLGEMRHPLCVDPDEAADIFTHSLVFPDSVSPRSEGPFRKLRELFSRQVARFTCS